MYNDSGFPEHSFVKHRLIHITGKAGKIPEQDTMRAVIGVRANFDHVIERIPLDGAAAALGTGKDICGSGNHIGDNDIIA